MGYFKLVPAIYLKNGLVVDKNDNSKIVCDGNPVELARHYANSGADELLIFDISDNDEEHDKNISAFITISDAIDIPIIVGGNVKRLEDVKKYLYTGAKKAFLDGMREDNLSLISEAADRFGSDKIAVKINEKFDFDNIKTVKYDGASLIIADNCAEKVIGNGIKVMSYNSTNSFDDIFHFSQNEKTYGVCHDVFDDKFDYMDFKHQLKEQGINVAIFEPMITFAQLKKDEKGLIPVVVQDYKTDKVLMLAYMNEDAFNNTIKTGKMTYYSRSRDELWVKGLTSGHYQFVKQLKTDCDNDTILAKVYQVGVPCHTGADTCFFNEIIKKDYDETNPVKVFEEVYKVIADRKTNPKEGSYTNYLFDKGIDKILKKVGEEATEIIIAAKNPDSQEVKYEISDFLYHVMVLMVEKGVTWKEIMKELSRR